MWSDLSQISNYDSPNKPGQPGSNITEAELDEIINKLKGETDRYNVNYSELMMNYDMRELAKYIDKNSL
jgi:hypothetical protein